MILGKRPEDDASSSYFVQCQFMTQEGYEARLRKMSMVVKEPEIEKNREPEAEFEKQKAKKERKHKPLKEKEKDNTAYKDYKTAIKHYSKKASVINERDRQKQEEVKRSKRERLLRQRRNP